jgi:hypothetical protein
MSNAQKPVNGKALQLRSNAKTLPTLHIAARGRCTTVVGTVGADFNTLKKRFC